MRRGRFLTALFAAQLVVMFRVASAQPTEEPANPTTTPAEVQKVEEPALPSPTAVDAVAVLDNSGSMRTNDPKFRMREVVSTFASHLTPESRLGIIRFDETAEVLLGLTEANAPDFKEQVDRSLSRINYRGQRTDIPAGIERALYELRSHKRPNAQPVIIFLTDGIVDIGNPTKDVERARWLRDGLAQEAKKSNIRIFGIALTDTADFELIQSVAQTTEGDYYRVLTAQDIAGTFERIRERIDELTRPVKPSPQVEQSQPAVPQAPSTSAPTPEPIVVKVSEPWPLWLLGVIGVLAFGAALAAIVALRRSQPSATQHVVVPSATLYDHSGASGSNSYPITKQVTWIGRESMSNDVVIAQDTVSGKHATIEFRDGAFYLCDRRSMNGTFVNGEKVSGPQELKNHNRIRFDAYEFEFVLDGFEDLTGTKLAVGTPAHGTRLRAEMPITPAPAQEAPNPQPAAAVDGKEDAGTKVKPDMCWTHPSWKGTHMCPECQHVYCKNCVQEKDGRTLCIECFAKAA
ncbi:MAG: VWA domain-containing protein [Deltaproteobacteria bacterium]|nr:VWA domain-containing protein [Deltaproteobacteria bacterium]